MFSRKEGVRENARMGWGWFPALCSTKSNQSKGQQLWKRKNRTGGEDEEVRQQRTDQEWSLRQDWWHLSSLDLQRKPETCRVTCEIQTLEAEQSLGWQLDGRLKVVEKETEKDTWGWKDRPWSWTSRIYAEKMADRPKAIYRVNEITIKVAGLFSSDT